MERRRAGDVPSPLRLQDAISRESVLRGWATARATWQYSLLRYRPKIWACPILFRVPGIPPEGAEKSCRTRRRKRGLRKGHRRSRDSLSRRSVPSRQPNPKSPNARKVNHIGRKFIWAARTNNKFSKACGRVLKHPYPCYRGWWRVWKTFEVWWQRLAERARLCNIPYQAAFGATWDGQFGYFRTGINWPSEDDKRKARLLASETLGELAWGLRARMSASPPRQSTSEGKRPLTDVQTLVKTGPVDSVGNTLRTEPVVVCRHCKGLGTQPGIGYPRGCRFCYRAPRRGNRGGGSSSLKRGRR